ncbi:cytochrome P450 [Karstenula rhodostoma CBS 690.94]|uniref:Cytochrome P450 n=1 Tax=Karstenula rhodostoma CBS 690.94 TaxID=1392251 RepID=A0A9P4U6L8_9PLEO|nr:cytochrome P450 [Karstenula rhodostoma CBS 690.94]
MTLNGYLFIATGIILLLIVISHRRRMRSKLPPGPHRLPIIGNTHQAPNSAPWLTFQKWIQQYGPLVSVDFGGTTVVLIGDYDIAKDLLDKRGNVYSARPRMVMAAELTCKEHHILIRQPDARYMLHQRLEAPVLSPRASTTYTPVQDMESKVLLHNFLRDYEVTKNCEIYAASIAYILTYGFRVVTNDEWQMDAARAVNDNFVRAAQPGAWVVDAFPVMKMLPACIAPFKKKAENFWRYETDLHLSNLREALNREGYNWCKDFVLAKEAKDMPEEELAWDLGVLADAAIETSNVFLQTFILACVAYPEFMTTARKEIDGLVGQHEPRMPEFADLENLPYIHAVVEEVFRWHHILPAGVAHATLKDDWYNGFFIPKGSTIVPVWKAMREDTKRYDEPLHFRPERWTGKNGQSNNWGYGRRICTGRHIAKNTITIAVARLLWAFDIKPANGDRIEVDDSMFTEGFVSHPKPFEAVFQPRSEAHREVIETAYDNAEKDVQSLMATVRYNQQQMGLKLRV